MESPSEEYQKYISQIQFLRKQISGEKLAHENTLKQLQSSYQIIDEMKDGLRAEQSTNIKLKNELTSTTNKLTAVIHQYEQQIAEIKEMISLKDEELRRINSFLMVNDADIIRLKVINEVELTHKEELQKLHHQITRKNTQNNEISSNYKLVCNKIQYLQKQITTQQDEHKDQIQEINNKFINQLKDAFQLLQKQRNQHNKWAKKYELLQSRFHKQTQFYKSQISKLNQQLQNENKSLLSNNQAKINKHKAEKLEETVLKLKQELANQKHTGNKFEDQINRYKKDLKNLKKQQIDFAIQRQKYIEEIHKLKDQISIKDNKSKKQAEAVHKQYQQKSDQNTNAVRESKQRMQRLEIQNKKISYRLQQLQVENQALKEQSIDKNYASMKKQITEKQEQINTLREEIRSLRKNEVEKKRTISLHQKKDENINHHKAKLQEANEKIVQLLRQKIELKKEINSLKASR